MKKSLNVFFAISKSYIQHFTAAATSLLENNKDLDVKIFVIHNNIAESDFAVCCKFFDEKYGIHLRLIAIGNIDFSLFRTTELYQKYTYYRLFLADLAPDDVDQALFVDSDIIVTGSLVELAGKELKDDEYICAVSEVSVTDNVERLNSYGFPVKSYFNAGVFLVNVKMWRRDKLSQKFLSIAKESGHLMKWVDQDILNIYFAHNWIELDSRFNAVHLIRKKPITPLIIHYNTCSKPWFYVDTHPYNKLYWKYLDMTPYKGSRVKGFSLKNFILKNGRLLKRELREAGLMSYK